MYLYQKYIEYFCKESLDTNLVGIIIISFMNHES